MSKHFSIQLSDAVYKELTVIAQTKGIALGDLIRRSLAVVKAAEKYGKNGMRLGFTRTAEQLDIKLIGL
jgi:predicted methyltransferase MtxX (methanogen marker protein 4)